MERIVSSKVIFTCPICAVSENTVEFPDGSRSIRYFIHRPSGVMILALTKQHELLLLREWRSAAGRELWWLPTGLIEPNESPQEAAQRELQEEAGVRAEKLTLLLRDTGTSGYQKQDLYLFVAEGLVPSKKGGDEHEEIKIMPTPITKAFRMAETLEIESPLIIRAILALKKYLTEREK